jgi:hypothetical protein
MSERFRQPRLISEIDVPEKTLAVQLMPEQHLFGVRGAYNRRCERICGEAKDVVGVGVGKKVEGWDGCEPW